MSETPRAKRRLDRPFWELLRAQENYVRTVRRHEQARIARDDAIRTAAASGFTRRAIAQATNLTAGRIQQIIDYTR